MKIHPNDLALEGLLLSLEKEQRRLLLHVTGCSYCRTKLYYLPRESQPGESAAAAQAGPDYDGVLDEVLHKLEVSEASLNRERDEAPGLFIDLLRQPTAEQERRLREDPAVRTWGVFELLIERSRETWTADPVESEELARLALLLSDFLDAALYGRGTIEDMRARAWAYIGNARRIRADLRRAEEAFDQAHSHLEIGSGDPLERGILLDLRSSLVRDQRDFEAASSLLRQAVQIFLQAGDSHSAGRSLVNLSVLLGQAQQPEKAIVALLDAIGRIDPEREPRLLLCARHNLVTHLADSGRHLEAQRAYREARPLYRSFAEPWVQNRRKWVRAKIARGLGHAAHAETLFLQARDGFVAEGASYDTALVSLEIATLYAEQGRVNELKALAAEMLPFFTSRRIHREALAALAFFFQAAEAERATREIIQSVSAFLKRAEHDPELRFQEPEG